MNFGEILDEWDKRGGARFYDAPAMQSLSFSSVVCKAAGDSTALQERVVHTPKKAEILDAWLRVKGVYDKDAEAVENPRQAGERRRRLRRKKPDAVIDLHGLTQDEAWTAMDTFFKTLKQQGLEKALIIHGKGNHPGSEGVLRELVRKFIETCPLAGESGYTHAVDGGSGATWVILK